MKIKFTAPISRLPVIAIAAAWGCGLWPVTFGLVSGASAAFVYDNPYELQSGGDFDGDGRGDLMILDKASGGYRIGYQLSPGSYAWVSARASGIADATGLGIGKLDSLTFDSLAVTGPDANRVNIFDASNTASASLPASAFIPSLGPNLVGVIDIGGVGNTAHDDLYVASLYNGVQPFRETLLRNDGTTNQTVLADNLIFYQRERANAVLIHTNRYARLALFDRNVGANADEFEILDLSSGAAASAASTTTSRTPQPDEYVTGQFDTGNPYTQFLLYPPTGSYFYEYQVIEPTPGNYALAYTNTITFTDFIDRIFALPGTNGTKLLVLYSNDVTAAVFNFDGHNPPVLVQSFSADPGQHFTGAGVLGNSGFMAYSAPPGQNTSANFKQWNWTGSGYSNSTSGNLPRISSYSASGNVMQFRFEPFVTNNPILLRLNNAGDWSESPSFSGSPGNISVKTETFLNATQGLANPTVVSLGTAHPLAQFGLANQYSNVISLFSFTPPAGDKISDVTISPTPGTYAAAFKLQFTAANPSDNIYFRLGVGAWNTWSNGLIAWVFTNTTVQYYGQPTNPGYARSLVKSATYAFTAGPSTLDSDGDGVPDYVEIAKGLDPTGGRDSDGDGYSDLEELIHGTSPTNAAAAPTNYPHLDDQAVFDLHVTPKPWDGFSNAMTLCATGTVLYAYDLQGSLLGEAAMDLASSPSINVSNITIVLDDRLVAEATDLHYHILTTNVDTKVGREMVGLIPVPSPPFPTISYTFGSAGGNITNEANNWIIAASNALINLPRATLTNEFTVNSSLESLLFERGVAQLLGARGNIWWTNITLFPFRPSDAGRTNPPQSLLLALESATTNQPGYLLQTLFAIISNQVEDSVAPDITSLRAVVQDIYRTDSLLNNTNPAMFVSPVDEIRYFLWNGTEDSNYVAWATTSGQFHAASNGAAEILAALSPRPTTNVLLVVRADTLSGSCRLLDLFGGGATFALVDSGGLPFAFPGNFQMLPGTVVEVSGYTDVASPGCGWPAIEVTAAMLNSVPIATDADSDGNLLIDSWEERFFGHTGIDPFADTDGDGYQNLQEMLEGSDPNDGYGRPAVLPVNFQQPMLALQPNGGQIEVHFSWPAMYIGRFNFGIRHTSDLTQPFSDLMVSPPVQVAGDEFKIAFTAPPGSQHYYYLTIALH